MYRMLSTLLSYTTLVLIVIFLIETFYFIKNHSLFSIYENNLKLNLKNVNQEPFIKLNEDLIDFEGFDNKNGVNKTIIPNIVHLLFLQQPKINFYQLVNILSIFYNHRPEFIYFHCDDCNFKGKYFDALKNFDELWKIIKFYKIPFQKTIFGAKYSWVNHHRSDVWRLMLLMNYGGVFLDNDVYVVNSLKKYFNYEMVVSWDDPHAVHGLGVQVLIAHRNARLLKAHFDHYRYNYTPSSWYYNAGHVPAKILRKNKDLAKIVKIKLGTQMLTEELFKKNWPKWKEMDTIHLMINHRFYLDKESSIKEFNEINIWNYTFTYGEMCRSILTKANLFLPKNKQN